MGEKPIQPVTQLATWILNSSVRGQVSSSSTSFWTPLNLNWECRHLRLKVQRCPMLSRQPICIKYQDENNIILGVDTSELRFGGVQNSSSSWKLVLELSNLNHTLNCRSCHTCVRIMGEKYIFVVFEEGQSIPNLVEETRKVL